MFIVLHHADFYLPFWTFMLNQCDRLTIFWGFGMGFRVAFVNRRVYVGFRGIKRGSKKTPNFVLIRFRFNLPQ